MPVDVFNLCAYIVSAGNKSPSFTFDMTLAMEKNKFTARYIFFLILHIAIAFCYQLYTRGEEIKSDYI